MYRSHVLVCGGTGCTSSHSAEIIAEFEKEIAEKGHADEIKVIRTGCFGLCALGPIVVVYPEGAFYSQIKVEDVPEIVDEHLIKGRIVKHLLYDDTVAGDTVKSLNETQFYKKQKRVALRNCGVIDPENIDKAIDLYEATVNQVAELTEKLNKAKESGEEISPDNPLITDGIVLATAGASLRDALSNSQFSDEQAKRLDEIESKLQ